MNEAQFLEAVTRMRDRLYRAAMAILWDEQDAADAVQEAMLKGWRRRGTLRDPAQFGAWFMRILVNQCRDMQRRMIRQRRLLEAAGERQRAAAPPASPGVLEAVRSLPEALRLPVLLYYFEGYSQAEVGRIVGATPGQVKARIRQGRAALRRALGSDGER